MSFLKCPYMTPLPIRLCCVWPRSRFSLWPTSVSFLEAKKKEQSFGQIKEVLSELTTTTTHMCCALTRQSLKVVCVTAVKTFPLVNPSSNLAKKGQSFSQIKKELCHSSILWPKHVLLDQTFKSYACDRGQDLSSCQHNQVIVQF